MGTAGVFARMLEGLATAGAEPNTNATYLRLTAQHRACGPRKGKSTA